MNCNHYQGDRDEIEFAHLFFLRGQEHLLDQIKRKVSTAPKTGGIGQQFMPRIKSEKVIIQQLPTPEVGQREELVVTLVLKHWTPFAEEHSLVHARLCPWSPIAQCLILDELSS